MKKPVMLLLIVVVIAFIVIPAGRSSDLDRWVDLSGKRLISQPDGASRLSGITPVRSSVSSLELKVSLPGFYRSRSKMADGNVYSILNATGSGKMEVGKPDLPVFGRMILVPNGTRSVLEVKPGKPRIYKDIEIAPCQPPLPDEEDGPAPTFARDSSVYTADADFPGSFASLEPIKRVRGRDCTVIRLYPYRYNPVRKRLLVYPDLEVTVRFKGVARPLPSRLESRSFNNLLRRSAVNGDAVISGGEMKMMSRSDGLESDSGSEGACEYLIVTHPDFSDAADILAAWKRKVGFRTHVATTSDTGSTAAEIITYLQDAYDNWDPAPEYLLLIGDVEFIPTNYETVHPNSGSLIGTDLYYTTLDGSDYLPDLSAGRLSIDTAAEAEDRVAAIIAYESDPPTDSSFYETAVICTYFQHYGYGYADRRFAQTSEDLALFLSDSSYLGEYSVERFYYTQSTVTPTNWSPFYFGGGPAGDPWDPIPTHLEKPAFPWDGDAAGISAAVNSGCFLLTHRDHGSATAWSKPAYSTSHVSGLTNGELLPVVWSINCKTGWFDKETSATPSSTISFSETWERNASGGAAGVIAASRVSYSGHNDRLFWGWTDAIWPDFVSGYSGTAPFTEPAYRMGDVLNYGKLYYATTYSDDIYRKVEFEIYHWFGDPSMRIRTELPGSLLVEHPSSVGFGAATDIGIIVETGSAPLEGATVTISRSELPDDYRVETTDGSGEAVFSGLLLSETGAYDLVVTAPNTIPYQGTILADGSPTPPPPPIASPTPSPRYTHTPTPFLTPTPWTATVWPAGSGMEIGSGLPSGYEPSGIVWHERYDSLFLVSDDGWVSWMDQSGAVLTTWTPGGDLEGITIVDSDSDYLYLGVEEPETIREFDISTGVLTGKSWDLSAWMPGVSGQGLEALTFVPNGHHPYSESSSGGLFYAGLQADGRIYVFDVDLEVSGSVSYVDTIEPYSGLTDLSGLHYHGETGVLYAVFDSWNYLLEMETDGTVIEVYELAGDTQEGVTLMPSCPISETSIFIAEDAGEVWRYDGYPVNCPSAPTPTPTSTPTVSPPTPTPPPTSTPTPITPTPSVTPTPRYTTTPTPSVPPTPSVTPTPRYTTTPTPFLSPTPTPHPDARIIICLGDSVTHGYPYADNGNPQLTYPSLLSGLLELEYGPDNFAIFNQGVNGYRAEDVVNDLSLPGALSEDPDYILLKVGGNDLAGATVLTILDIIEETTWEVQSCIDLATAHLNSDGSHPEVIVSAFIPNLLEDEWGSLAISYYNQSLEDNLSGYALWFTDNWDDFYDVGTGEAKVSLMYDSTHPNSDGYQVMAENWFDAIQVLMIVVTPTPVTVSPTPTASPPPTVTPTAAPTASPPPTVTPTAAPTASPPPTLTPTAAPTASPPPTVTPTAAPTVSPSPTATVPPTPTPSVTPTPRYTVTPIPSATPTPVPAPTAPHLVVDWDDYDGDGTSDLAVYDPESGEWSIENITTGVVWGGGEGDIPAPGDYDGDGTAELAYFDRYNGEWNIMKSSGEVITTGVKWGAWGDVPAPGDYDGDGSCDFATWRPSDGRWRIMDITNIWYGQAPGMYPVPGDYNGDGTTDIAMMYPGAAGGTNMWYVNGIRIRAWMTDDGVAIPLDYDGDGTTDLGVFNPSNQYWCIRHLSSSTMYFKHWGIPGDIPVVGDFDGDGSADLTTFRNASGQSWWWILYSSKSYYYSNFSAQTGDSIVVGATGY